MMNVLLVDDEPLARERLRALLAEIGGIAIAAEAGDGRAALEEAERTRPDLVLLDIRMPVMDGLEAARHLAALDPPPGVIFCSAYGDHALAAFDADAVDYLVKPVRLDRLRAALDKARRLRGAAPREPSQPQRRRTHLCARVRGNLVLVPVEEIDYLLAEDKYVAVHYPKGRVLIEESLTALESEFEGRFVRIHRNCLVAQARLTGLSRAADGRLLASLRGVSAELEVSRRNLPAVRRLVRSL
jgi:two-component system response regulator AlgR